MNNSYFLRQRLQQDRQMALSLDKAARGVYDTAYETTSDITDGLERLSWKTACLFDKYEDVCQELKREDKRVNDAIKELYKRHDVILDMFILYVEYVLRNKERTRRNMQSTVRTTSRTLANFIAGLTTKRAIVYTIGKVLSESMAVSMSLRKVAYNRWGVPVVTAIEYYGKLQKAAMAARKLKMLEPVYYNILYANNLEMLYIYIEPVMSRIIIDIKSKGDATFEEVIESLERIAL